MKNKAPEPMPRIPTAVSVSVAVLFFIPFICVFLPTDFPMDRDWRAPYLAYTTPLAYAAFFFYYLPMLICDSFRPISDLWFFVGAFIQSLLLTLLVLVVIRALLWSRWRQLHSRAPA